MKNKLIENLNGSVSQQKRKRKKSSKGRTFEKSKSAQCS